MRGFVPQIGLFLSRLSLGSELHLVIRKLSFAKMSYLCISDYEKRAEELLPKVFGYYYNGGAGEEWNIENNLQSFKRYRLLPKCLVDVSKMNIETNILGFALPMPVGISPTAMHKFAHVEGEIATARAAESTGTVYTMSCIASASIEDVAKEAPNATKWLQLNIFENLSITETLVRKAEANGFNALVLTVDSPATRVIYSCKRNGFRNQIPEHVRPVNVNQNDDGRSGLMPNFKLSSTWEDLKWLLGFTDLPVIVKGVMRPDDAMKAVEAGCAAVWVSNHGGRLVDTTPAPIEVLPEIVEAIGGRVPIFMDCGVRVGTDVLKALALGADMVFLGRPILWGLAVDGQAGVEHVLDLIKEELLNSMALCGIPELKDINKEFVVHESHYGIK